MFCEVKLGVSITLRIFLVLELMSNYVYGQRFAKFFRKDYDYLDPTDSFYKFHSDAKTWMEAKSTCSREGAVLFFSVNQTETDAVLTHMKMIKHDFPQGVFYGVSDLIVEGIYETVDGRPLFEVYSNWGNGEPNNADNEDCTILRGDATINDEKCSNMHSFICKKTLASLEWNGICNIPYSNYVYNENTHSCYKLHSTPLSWTEAYGVCVTEQSYLSVINTQIEADYLVEITAKSPKRKPGDYVRGAVHIGFRKPQDEDWITVRGKSLEESGYSTWADNQPDGTDGEKCGSMSYDGRLNAIGCDQRAFFICEHDVKKLSTSLNITNSEDKKATPTENAQALSKQDRPVKVAIFIYL